MSEEIALDALILDFGGVLYPIDYDAPVRSFEALGFGGFRSLYHQAAQSSRFDALEVGALQPEAFIAALLAHCHAGTKPSDIASAWNSILLRMPPERLGAVQLLGAKTRLFLFSNTNAIHAAEFEARMEEDGLLAPFQSAFEAIHYSHELGLRKPHPEAFASVCARHGLDPQRTGFVDDSAHHVDGARAAGLHALHYLPDSGKDLLDALSASGWRFS